MRYKDDGLTPCELAFVTMLRKMSAAARKPNEDGYAKGEHIISLWSESFEDWLEAVGWGQEHPDDKKLTSKDRCKKFRPQFLTRGGDDMKVIR